MSKTKNSEKKQIGADILVKILDKSKKFEIYKKNENDFYIKIIK